LFDTDAINRAIDDAIVLKSSFALGFAQFTEDVTITNCSVSGFDIGTFLNGTYKRENAAKVHNDSGAVNDSSRVRGTIRGTGNETEEIDNIITKKHEIVHSFGWYIRKYIDDSKAKGAIPIVCSLIPRNNWEKGKVVRSSEEYAKWAEESALMEKAFYINLNEIIAAKYEKMGEDAVKTKLFLSDHTHTTEAGAIINAASVAEGIKALKGGRLKKYLVK
jgi:hypothetical protein